MPARPLAYQRGSAMRLAGRRGRMTAMWQAFDPPQSLFLALAALAGLAVGGWLTLLTHRLPRMMERVASALPGVSRAGRRHGAGVRAGLWPARTGLALSAMLGAGPGLAPAAAGGLAAAQGRCAACGAAIGWRYPAIELLTAVLFAACAWRFGPTPIALCGMGLSASLVALAWIDLESTLLPDAITLPLAWAGLLVNLGDGFTPLPLAVLGAVAGYGFLWLIFHAFRYFTGREGMGYGDLLLAALGAWFGVGALPMLLLAASLAGVLVGGTMTLAGRARRGQPCLSAPTWRWPGWRCCCWAASPGWQGCCHDLRAWRRRASGHTWGEGYEHIQDRFDGRDRLGQVARGGHAGRMGRVRGGHR